MLSCMSCLYILEISPLLVAVFANIFSQSVGCLFILLMVSFTVQKLLCLIRSHLFIFLLQSLLCKYPTTNISLSLLTGIWIVSSLGVL